MDGLVDKYCENCIHLEGAKTWRYFRHCNYILDVGRPRPCPAGKGCTEYRPAGKRKTHRVDPWDNWNYITDKEENRCD
jgi:hypothetical protein